MLEQYVECYGYRKLMKKMIKQFPNIEYMQKADTEMAKLGI